MRSLIIIFFLFLASIIYGQDKFILYPNPNECNHDGLTWESAFPSFLYTASCPFEEVRDADINEGDEIWVSGGDVEPGTDSMQDDRWDLSPNQVNNSTIYGGFSGNETQLSQRNLNSPSWIERLEFPPLGMFSEGYSNITLDGFSIGSLDAFLNEEEEIKIVNCQIKNIEISSLDLENYTPFVLENYSINDLVTSESPQATCNVPNGLIIRDSEITGFSTAPNYWFTYLYTNVRFENCIFSGNSCDVVGDNCEFVNCLFVNNSFTRMIDSVAFLNCKFDNCTIVDNECEFNFAQDCSFTNCIIWDNNFSDFYTSYETSVLVNNVHNIDESMLGTAYLNYSNDPQFVSDTDFNLTYCSPGINISLGTEFTEYDIDGNPRIVGTYADLGCYEFQEEFSSIIYVDADANGTNNGSSWENAFTQLEDALAVDGCDTGEIWVAEGSYYPPGGNVGLRNESFILESNVKVYGGFNGTESLLESRNIDENETRLSGAINGFGNSDNSYHVLTSEGNTSPFLLDGFTISGGNSDGDDLPNQRGGGFYGIDSKGKFSNCIFEFNNAIEGGGAYVSGNCEIEFEFCSFQNNNANESAGGLYINDVFEDSDLALVNGCEFISNTIEESDGNGGGMFVKNSTPNIQNSLFTSNECENGAAVYLTSNSDVEFIHNTVIDHTLSSAIKILLSTFRTFNCIYHLNSINIDPLISTVEADNNIMTGVDSSHGTNVFEVDPLIINIEEQNYSLSQESPAIDLGNSIYSQGIPKDIYGMPRTNGLESDLGCQEFYDECTPPNNTFENAQELNPINELPQVTSFSFGCANQSGDPESLCGGATSSLWFKTSIDYLAYEIAIEDLVSDDLNDPLDVGFTIFEVYNGILTPISCRNSFGPNEGELMIVEGLDVNPNSDFWIQVLSYNGSGSANLRIQSFLPEVISVVQPFEGTISCNEEGNFIQYLELEYNRAPAYGNFIVNGVQFPITLSPQNISIPNLPGTGEIIDVEVVLDVFGQTISDYFFPAVATAPCCVENDDMNDALYAELNTTYFGDNNCATSLNDFLTPCTGVSGLSLWYEFDVPASGSVTITSTPLVNYNGNLKLRHALFDEDNNFVGCSNNGGANEPEIGIFTDLTPGDLIRLRVDGTSTQKGFFSILITENIVAGCSADYNNDQIVNGDDLITFLSNYGCTAGNCFADLTGDGNTNAEDLAAFLSQYGEYCN